MSDIKKSEVEKLLDKLKSIKKDLAGEEDNKDMLDSKGIKDKFYKSKVDLTRMMNEVDTYLSHKDELDNKDVMKKHVLIAKIDDGLSNIKKELTIIQTELNAQKKKKGKYKDLDEKEKLMGLLNERYLILKVMINTLTLLLKLE